MRGFLLGLSLFIVAVLLVSTNSPLLAGGLAQKEDASIVITPTPPPLEQTEQNPEGAESTNPEESPVDASAQFSASWPLINHSVIYGENSIMIVWDTVEPSTGWIEYGSSADGLELIAQSDGGPEELARQHSVEIRDLPMNGEIYYRPVVNGVPVQKEGRPYFAYLKRGEVPVSQPTVANASRRFWVDLFGLSFVPPEGWRAAISSFESPQDTFVDVTNDDGLVIMVMRHANPEFRTVDEWFSDHVADFDSAAVVRLGNASVDGSPALFLAQPESCRNAAMLLTFIANGASVFEIVYLKTGEVSDDSAFASLVGSLRFSSDETGEWQPIPSELATVPVSSQALDCAEQSASSKGALTICAGSDMGIPSNGTLLLPWGCFNDDPYCYPYKTNSPRGSYFSSPHRGLDIRGTENVSPVFATYSGYAYKLPGSSIRLAFNNRYQGMSARYSHMKSANGNIDYRTITNGQFVSRGHQIGRMGSYDLGGSPVHLHVSFNNNQSANEPWPSLNPTKFLSAKNLVYYRGWNHTQNPIQCASPNADGYEPDNFSKHARTFSFGRTAAQRGTFHAPDDEDWVEFSAVAGYGYRITAQQVGALADTVLHLYSAANLTQPLLTNDDADGTWSSRIDWVAGASGTYYVRIMRFGYFSDGTAYDPAQYRVPYSGASTEYNFQIVTNVAFNRNSWASSQHPNFPPRSANDGTAATRWSSRCSWGDETWGVDIGNAWFNEVFVNFEAAYPSSYFVGWWNPGDQYATGSWYTASSSGLYRHHVGIRRATNLGVWMTGGPWWLCNFSMWELSAYHTPANSLSSQEYTESSVIDQISEGGIVQVKLSDLNMRMHVLYLPLTSK
jgi:hypothetical protein